MKEKLAALALPLIKLMAITTLKFFMPGPLDIIVVQTVG
jgi:hypothetical protein